MSSQLIERHRSEQEFHDRASQHARTDFYAWGALHAADAYAFERLGDIRGKVVLDLGCGDGSNAIRLAQHGAQVYAVDLSAGMVATARQKAEQAGLAGQVYTQQMSAEYLGFADASFDYVFGHSVLHHTDLAISRREIARILRPGGRAIFLEPLDHNPLLHTFRRLTPWRRTRDEKPLRIGEVAFFAEPFTALQHREFYLLALVAFALVPLRIPRLFQAAMAATSKLDTIVLSRWPALGKYAWVIVMELTR